MIGIHIGIVHVGKPLQFVLPRNLQDYDLMAMLSYW